MGHYAFIQIQFQSFDETFRANACKAVETCRARVTVAMLLLFSLALISTTWPSGLRRWLQAPVRKGMGSNPTAFCYVADPSQKMFYRRTLEEKDVRPWNPCKTQSGVKPLNIQCTVRFCCTRHSGVEPFRKRPSLFPNTYKPS